MRGRGTASAVDEVYIMNKTNNSKLTANAQVLRKSMTKEERHLWYDFFKTLPISVNRQKVIGRYIVDFYCATAKTVIELDGSQHYKSQSMLQDKVRDNYLRSLGITVSRYSNYDVNTHFKDVCEDIFNHIFEIK